MPVHVDEGFPPDPRYRVNDARANLPGRASDDGSESLLRVYKNLVPKCGQRAGKVCRHLDGFPQVFDSISPFCRNFICACERALKLTSRALIGCQPFRQTLEEVDQALRALDQGVVKFARNSFALSLPCGQDTVSFRHLLSKLRLQAR